MHAFDRPTGREPWQYRALHYMQSRGKNDNPPFMCHLFSRVSEFIEAKKNLPPTTVRLISYFKQLCIAIKTVPSSVKASV